MARVNIPVSDIVRAGLTQPSAVTADATNDHYIDGDDNDGQVFLFVVSSDAGSQTLTIVANPDYNSDGLTLNDLTLTIAAGATKLFGPFRPRTFRQPSDGNRLYINPSVSTTLTMRAYRLEATP